MICQTLQRTYYVAWKEGLHIIRDRTTLAAMLMLPIVELFLVSYAIDTKIENVPTAVVDQAKTQQSRALLERFRNTGTFDIVEMVGTEEELHQAIVAGRVKVGIMIPHSYSRDRAAGDQAEVLLMVDGSLQSMASQAVVVGQNIALTESLQANTQSRLLSVDSCSTVLFNPELRSANSFVPAIMVLLCQVMAVFLASAAVVREKERGTLAQLQLSPLRPLELIVGKVMPYVALVSLEFCGIALLMYLGFRVPVRGAFGTLLLIHLPFLLSMLGLGLWISTRVETREAASQFAQFTVLPTAFLSGFVFPVYSLPPAMQFLAYCLPATWMVDASRGVVARGAGWHDLWLHTVVLWAWAIAALLFSTLQFRRRTCNARASHRNLLEPDNYR